jgi:3-hydroxyisobutyrate dehydrogenase-like beta-hydroxyacid dehydrogenase
MKKCSDEISSSFGEFFRHEGAVIQSGNYEISESPLRISVEATGRLLQAAREGGINSQFPAFVLGFFKEAAAEGYENEEVAALIKVFRAGVETARDPVNGPARGGGQSQYNSKVKESVK